MRTVINKVRVIGRARGSGSAASAETCRPLLSASSGTASARREHGRLQRMRSRTPTQHAQNTRMVETKLPNAWLVPRGRPYANHLGPFWQSATYTFASRS